ncbi:MAG TPA: flagellar hook-basal body complex protein FliE [Devosia sp.]|nr:flagellar hook-basal body complex protein FliE [Devosia sp.]
MSVPFSAATAAYGNAAQLVQGGGNVPSQQSTTGGSDFAKILSESVQSVVDTGNRADQVSMDMLNGKASVVDMVTAISETELAVESMVTVRDRVISAYQEILRMPI